MPTEIKAIQCPKCGSTQKTELKPGDFRCESCGTEYFIDDGTVKFGQTPPRPPEAAKKARSGSVAVWIFVGLIIGTIVLIGIFSSSTPTSTTRSGSHTGYSWYTSYASHLYLSSDKKPVLLTFGTKAFWGKSGQDADYVAFNDVRDGSVIAQLPVPDAGSKTDHSGGTQVELEEFADGDIFFIVEKAQLFRVRKTSYTITDVSRSMFDGLPEFSGGVAKIEFIYPRYGEGFELITNQGKKYYYYPATHEVRTDTVSTGRSFYLDAARLAKADEKAAIGFSTPWNSDFPDIPGQLVAFRYKVDPYVHHAPELDHSEGSKWDDPEQLKYVGVVSHRDFTPGRVYFDYGVLYFDDDYVLISYRLTPGKTAPRYAQLLNAKTAAVLFTTRLDTLYSPARCIRYGDGFAIDDAPRTFTLSFAGKLEQHTPEMFRGDNE